MMNTRRRKTDIIERHAKETAFYWLTRAIQDFALERHDEVNDDLIYFNLWYNKYKEQFWKND